MNHIIPIQIEEFDTESSFLTYLKLTGTTNVREATEAAKRWCVDTKRCLIKVLDHPHVLNIFIAKVSTNT